MSVGVDVQNKSPMAPKVPAGYERLAAAFCFYGEYHSNSVNQMIHIVFVPTILWSALFMAGYYRPDWLALPLLPNWAVPVTTALGGGSLAFPATLLYMIFYLYVAPLTVGVVAASVVACLAAAAVAVSAAAAEAGAASTAFYAALALNVLSWIAQFYGHGVHERRAPALLDNLYQALLMAPLFVGLEVAFKLGGFAQLRTAVETEIKSRVRAFQQQQQRVRGSGGSSSAGGAAVTDTLSPRAQRRSARAA